MATDRQKIRSAFAELRKDGIFARMSFRCCQNCARYEIRVDKGDPKNFVFWTKQGDVVFDEEGFIDRRQPLHLYWSTESQEKTEQICATLESHGLIVIRPETVYESIQIVRSEGI